MGSLVVADFDGDGEANVAFANSNQIVVLRGKGNGTARASVAFPVHTGASFDSGVGFQRRRDPRISAVADSGANNIAVCWAMAMAHSRRRWISSVGGEGDR